MYMDKMIEFSDAQAMTSKNSGVETVSTDIVDLGIAETDAYGTTILPNIGDAGELVWHVFLAAAHAGGSATYTCELIAKSTASSMSASSTIIDSFIIPNAAAKGTHYQRPVPMNQMAASDRYMAVLYRSNTDTTDSITIDSWVSMDRDLTDTQFGAIV